MMVSQTRRAIKVPWSQVSFEDKRAMAGGGRAGFEARQKNGYGDRRY